MMHGQKKHYGILRLKCDGTRAEIRFRLSPKRTSPFKSAGTSVQLTAGSRDVLINVSNAGYTMFRGSVRVLATHSIPLHFPSRASPCAIRFQMHSTEGESVKAVLLQAWSGSEISRKLRFLDFMTTVLDGGKVVSLTHRPPLPPEYTPGTLFC